MFETYFCDYFHEKNVLVSFDILVYFIQNKSDTYDA